MGFLIGWNDAATGHVGLADEQVEVEVFLSAWDGGLRGGGGCSERAEAQEDCREKKEIGSKGGAHGVWVLGWAVVQGLFHVED